MGENLRSTPTAGMRAEVDGRRDLPFANIPPERGKTNAIFGRGFDCLEQRIRRQDSRKAVWPTATLWHRRWRLKEIVGGRRHGAPCDLSKLVPLGLNPSKNENNVETPR